MASIPFIGPAIRHRKPMTGARMIIVAAAAAFAVFLLWASLAQVDEVTRGEGKVIPSSKLQIITAADPATVSELLVRSGQHVHKGELLVRLDSPENESQLGQLQAETESLQARASRLSAEGGLSSGAACSGADCAGQEALRAARQSALRSKVAAANATADPTRPPRLCPYRGFRTSTPNALDLSTPRRCPGGPLPPVTRQSPVTRGRMSSLRVEW